MPASDDLATRWAKAIAKDLCRVMPDIIKTEWLHAAERRAAALILPFIASALAEENRRVNSRPAWVDSPRKRTPLPPAPEAERGQNESVKTTKTISVRLGCRTLEREVPTSLNHVCGSHGYGLRPDDFCEMCVVQGEMFNELAKSAPEAAATKEDADAK